MVRLEDILSHLDILISATGESLRVVWNATSGVDSDEPYSRTYSQLFYVCK